MRIPLDYPIEDPMAELDELDASLGFFPEPDDDLAEGRVPSGRLKSLIDKIQEELGLSERQVIHRYLAHQVGVSTRSVLRYDKGDVATTPGSLVRAAQDVLERVSMGRPIVFLRGREMRPVVVRKQVVDLVDRIVRSGLFEDRFELFRLAEEKLQLKSGRVARLYRSTDVQLIDEEVYECIAALATKARYEPRSTYQVGDRLRHPIFGVGSVVEKVPKQKILVRFLDGSEHILREQLEEDPVRRRLSSTFDVPDYHPAAYGRY